jgi:hypothetical protein
MNHEACMCEELPEMVWWLNALLDVILNYVLDERYDYNLDR